MKAIKNGKLIMNDKIVEGKVVIFDHKILDIREVIPTGLKTPPPTTRVLEVGLLWLILDRRDH